MKKKIIVYGCIGICIVLLMYILHVQANLQSINQPLSGVVIVLDAGHGGQDAGAQKEGVKEEEINLSIVQTLKGKVEEAGGSVVLTRDGDYDLASDGARNRKKEDMKKRVALINEEQSDLFISVHLNSFPNTQVHGAQVFYKKDDKPSMLFAQQMQEQLNLSLKQTKTAKEGDYYILNETIHPGVLVECGYLSNVEERNKLLTKQYQDEVATILYDSLCVYLEGLNI